MVEYYPTLERNKVLWLRPHKSEYAKKIKFMLHMSKTYELYFNNTEKSQFLKELLKKYLCQSIIAKALIEKDQVHQLS